MRLRRWCVVTAWVWCWELAQAAPRPECPKDSTSCEESPTPLDEQIYYVDGQQLYVKLDAGGYFTLRCHGNLTLEHPALPRLKELTRFMRVVLHSCPPPQQSYAIVLRALNVLPVQAVTIIGQGGALRRDHLMGLDVTKLELKNLDLAPDALEATPLLKHLSLDTAPLPPVERLPVSITTLLLVDAGLRNIDPATLAHFRGLQSLSVRESRGNITVQAVAPLRDIALQAEKPSSVTIDPALPDTLVNLTLFGWGNSTPVPWKTCQSLERLTVRDARATTLPDGWVANCPELRVLFLERAAALTSLANGTLANATALTRLTLKRTALTELPPELLYDANPLEYLNLSLNKLTKLTIGAFAKSPHLWSLDVSYNALDDAVLEVVSAVTSLRVLRLARNALGDACKGGANSVRGASPLETLRELTELDLRGTGVSHVCRDWVDSMPHLTALDLADNNIGYITYSDLRFAGNVAVDLSGNNVTQLVYTEHDFEEVRGSAALCRPAAPVDVTLSGALRCNCVTAWAARTLSVCPKHVLLHGARCAGVGKPPGRPLSAVPLDELECAVPRDACPAPCRCAWRPRGGSPARVVRVRCERAGLRALPALAALEALPELAQAGAAWELRLAHNRIAAPRPVDLPEHVLELDLRNNGIQNASLAAALLGDENRSVLLGGNPLLCTCASAPALARLGARARDFQNLTCAGGTPLRAPEDCGTNTGPSALLALALAPLLLAAVLLGGCLARPAWRARLKAILRGLGWLPHAPEPPDDRPYDVFLSFSHHDEEIVSGMVSRLEGGARPYRVCVHYRDWAPGGWIPAQIAASVRRSRRTLAVVSAHFLRSGWARAEFREAYGAALREAEPRLVVVLLDEPARLPLDDELRRYLAANTYVRWGDPWFWPKLRAALPPPRGRTPGPQSAAAGARTSRDARSAEPLMLQLSAQSLPTDARAAPPSSLAPLAPLAPLAHLADAEAGAAA